MDDYIYAPPPPPPVYGSGNNGWKRSKGEADGSRKRKKAGNTNSQNSQNSQALRPSSLPSRPGNKNGKSISSDPLNGSEIPQATENGNEDESVKDDESLDADSDLGEIENDISMGKLKSKPNIPVPIPGTSILLQTEEDTRRWIAERRKNWPTRQRVAEKEKLEKEKIKMEEKASEDISGREGVNEASAANEATNSIKDSEKKEGKTQVCRFFARSGKCRNGNDCKFLHVSAQDANTARKNGKLVKNKSGPVYQMVEIDGVAVRKYNTYTPNFQFPDERNVKANIPSLYKMLVKQDVDKENDFLLDFIEYLGDQKLIETKLSKIVSKMDKK